MRRLWTRMAGVAAVLAAAVGVAVVTQAGASESEQSAPLKTVKISIPGSTRSAKPTILTVQVPKRGTTIGIASPIHADPGQGAMDTANQRIAKLVGAKAVLEDAALDANKQLQIADSMLNRGFDTIITDILFPHSLDAFLARAKGKKVPVCIEFSSAPGGAQENDAQAGREIAGYLNTLYPKGAKGVILANTPAAVILAREQAIARGMKRYPKLKILEKQRNLKESIDGGRTIAEGFFQKYPDLQFIIATNDIGSLGAALAAKALGKKPTIIGMNGTPEAVNAVKQGLMSATWDSNQNLMGSVVAINCLNWLATGKAPKAGLIPFTRITKANAAQWIPWPQRPELTRIVK